MGVRAWAEDLTFSAKVDKTTVNMGDPISLTLTLSGDIGGVELPAVKFPEGCAIAARSQATNFSLHNAAVDRSISLVYVLVPQEVGRFQLGPFTITHRKKVLQTEPIEITVKKPPIPSHLAPERDRFTL